MNTMKLLLDHYKFSMPLLVLVFAVAFTACDVNNDDDEMGAMRVLLTDAPAYYEEVNIEILRVLVNQDGDEEVVDENGEGWVAIVEDSMNVNLLDYQHGETLELGEVELVPGRYNQIRLILGDNNTVVVDGETHTLTTPSAQQSGYKLNIQADVEEGEIYELVIDFDATQSVVETGNHNFILRPVLRTVDLQQNGSIAGTVLPIEAEPFIYAIIDEDTVGTQPDGDGDFRLTGLREGTYNVLFAPTEEAYADSLFEGIVIVNDEEYIFDETIVLENLAESN